MQGGSGVSEDLAMHAGEGGVVINHLKLSVRQAGFGAAVSSRDTN